MKSKKNGGGIVPTYNSPRICLAYILYFLVSCLKQKKKEKEEKKVLVADYDVIKNISVWRD